MSHEDMQAHLGRPDTPAFDMMIIRCYMTIIETGDIRQLDVLLDRLVGKVKDEVDINIKPTIIKRRDGSEVILGIGKEKEEE